MPKELIEEEIENETEENEEVEDKDFDSLTEDDFPDIDFSKIGEEILAEEESEEEKEQEVKEKNVEEKVEKKETVEKKEKEEEKKEVKEELKGIFDVLKKDETLKSKGLEVKLEDFSEAELKALLQKGLRFYQAMDELAKEKEAVSSRMQALEQAVEYLQRNQASETTKQKGKAAENTAQLSDDMFEVSEFDDPQVAALKTTLKQLSEKVNSLTSEYQSTQTQKEQEALLKEIESLKEDYPLANVEEVLAVHFLSGGKIPVQKVMEASQKYYGSPDFVKKIFQAHPEIRKSVEEEIVKNYLAKQSGKKSTPKVKVSGTASKPIVSKPSSEDITFENVSEKALDYLAELARLNKEEE